MSQQEIEKDKAKIVAALAQYGGTSNTAAPYEKAKAELALSCTEDLVSAFDRLTSSLDENSKTSSKLSNKIYYLNIILTIATVTGTLMAGISLYLSYCSRQVY